MMGGASVEDGEEAGEEKVRGVLGNFSKQMQAMEVGRGEAGGGGAGGAGGRGGELGTDDEMGSIMVEGGASGREGGDLDDIEEGRESVTSLPIDTHTEQQVKKDDGV